MKIAVTVSIVICLYLSYIFAVAEYIIPIVYPLGKTIGLPIVVFITTLPPILLLGYLYE